MADKQFFDLCRLCGTLTLANTRQLIFEGEGLQRHIPEKLKSLPVRVTPGDQLPQVLCYECLCKLDMTSDFFEMVRATEQHFKDMLYLADDVTADPDIYWVVGSDDDIISETENVELSTIKFEELSENGDFEDIKDFSPCSSDTLIHVEDDHTIKLADIHLSPEFIVEDSMIKCNSLDSIKNVDQSQAPDAGNVPHISAELKIDADSYPAQNVYVAVPANFNVHQSAVTPPVMLFQCLYCNLLCESKEVVANHIIKSHKGEAGAGDGESSSVSVSRTEEQACTKTSGGVPAHLIEDPQCKSTDFLKLSSEVSQVSRSPQAQATLTLSVAKSKPPLEDLSHLSLAQIQAHFFKKPTLNSSSNEKENKKKCLCKVCGKTFLKKRNREKHMSLYHSMTAMQFKCHECEKVYAAKNWLIRHLSEVHSISVVHVPASNVNDYEVKTQNVYECYFCKKLCKTKLLLTKHIIIHLQTVKDRKKYTCKICGEKFVRTATLKYHTKTIHSEKATCAICHICGKQFSHPQSLSTHLKLHSGPGYKCGVCGKTVNSKASLRNHVLLHTNERPHACHLCNAGYTQRSALLTHLDKTHGVDARIYRYDKTSGGPKKVLNK